MRDHQKLIEQQHIPADDGWDEPPAKPANARSAASFSSSATGDGQSAKEGTVIKDGTRLVALATVAMWVRWKRAGRSSRSSVVQANASSSGKSLVTPTSESGRPGQATSRKTPGRILG